MFADDTNIFYSHKDINLLFGTINNEIQNLNTWFAVSVLQLSLNTNKTHFMLFSNRKNSLPSTVKIIKIEIYRLYYTQFLGVIIYQNLSEHVNFFGKKVSKNIAIVRKAKHFANGDALSTLYN